MGSSGLLSYPEVKMRKGGELVREVEATRSFYVLQPRAAVLRETPG